MDEGTGPTIVIWRREESNWDNYKEENIPFFPFFAREARIVSFRLESRDQPTISCVLL